MLLISCPWCGDREEPEFGYGGQAHIGYPDDPAALDDQAWAEYLFFRDNPQGRFAERWVHSAGCRRWFNVIRDTLTNKIAATYRPGDPRPVLISAGPISAGPISAGPVQDGPAR